LRLGRKVETRTPEIEGRDQPPPAEPENAVAPMQAAPGPDLETLAQQSKLSEHLASVMRAAEDAASAIREEAKKEAELLRMKAEKERQALEQSNRDASRKAAEAAAEAERRRVEAEAAADAIRRRAEDDAAKKQQEAEVAAGEIIALAEQTAVKRTMELEMRDRATHAKLAETEERVRQFVTGLMDLAADLEALATSDSAAASHPSKESTETVDESLADRLKAYMSTESDQISGPVTDDAA
jgi:hypothetical protein